MQPQLTRQEVLVVPILRPWIRTFEKNEDRFLQSVSQYVARAELTRHITNRPQASVIASSLHLKPDLGQLRLGWFDDRDVIRYLSGDDRRRFLDQFGLGNLQRLPDKFRALLH